MNKEKLLQKIRKEFPDLKWKQAEHIVEGWDHYVLCLDNKYIFRFPRKKHYAKKLYSEVTLLTHLNQKNLGVGIPNYTFIAKDKSFAGYKMLQGTQLSPKSFHKLSTRAKYDIAKKLGGFLSKLHSIPIKEARGYGIGVLNTNKKFKELCAYSKKFLKPRLSKKNYVLIQEFLEESKQYLKYPHERFLHGDLHPYHLILSNKTKQLSGIIDFSDQSISDPAFDFGELWAYGEQFVTDVYRNYTGKKDKDFFYRSQLYYKRIPIWIMAAQFVDRGGKFKMGFNFFKEVFLK